MAMFSHEDRNRIEAQLQTMKRPVRLIHFTQTFQCELCADTRELLQDIVLLSDNLSMEVYNFQLDSEKVGQYRIDRVPATVIEGEKDFGVRLYGLPVGYEFVALLESILRVSEGSSGLAQDTIRKLSALKSPIHLEVFVTPTCPYCAPTVKLAHQLAMESELITADMVEASEFPDLARRYAVHGVPSTVVNGTTSIEGSMPEMEFIDQILAGLAIGKSTAMHDFPV